MTKYLLSVSALLLALSASSEASAQSYTCPTGYPVDCGNTRCCPSGSTCGGTCGGECCSPSNTSSTSSSGGGGTCPTGYPIDCGNSRCCPENSTCGGTCGGECCSTETTSSSSSSSSGGSYYSSSSSTGGLQTSGDDTVCQQTYAGSNCTSVQACSSSTKVYYIVDGSYIYCSLTSCTQAAQEVADRCSSQVNEGGGRSSKSCSMSYAVSRNPTLPLALFGVLGLVSLLRNRRRKG